MSSGVYRASVGEHRRAARRMVNKLQTAYQSLRDKTTPYAQEIHALVKLHAQVAQVWDQAADDIHEEGGR